MYDKASIPFHKFPKFPDREKYFINQVLESEQTCGNGIQCQSVEEQLRTDFQFKNVLLTPSATHALEMMALLMDCKPGDEVIMPSYTFTSTANAFALRGAKIVFVDIDESLNLCPQKLLEAINPNTKACVVIHYGGLAADCEALERICKSHNILLLEDAAHGLGAKYKNSYLGGIGEMGCLSFHQTKNVQCGEGGALIVQDEDLFRRAQIVQEKGTNRKEFKAGLVNKYQWQDIGTSNIMPELSAAYLRAHLEKWQEITSRRQQLFNLYRSELVEAVSAKKVQLPIINQNASGNGHIFYLLFHNEADALGFKSRMLDLGIQVTSHYEPLHLTKVASRWSRVHGNLNRTEQVAKSLVRLPLFFGLEDCQQKLIVEQTLNYLNHL